MYEVIEADADALPEPLKSFVGQNISTHERVLLCYLIHQTGFLLDKQGVVALTNQRLLCHGLRFHVSRIERGTVFNTMDYDSNSPFGHFGLAGSN